VTFLEPADPLGGHGAVTAACLMGLSAPFLNCQRLSHEMLTLMFSIKQVACFRQLLGGASPIM
jgi:hypothetical protein